VQKGSELAVHQVLRDEAPFDDTKEQLLTVDKFNKQLLLFLITNPCFELKQISLAGGSD